MPQDFPRVPLHPQGFDANRPYDTTTFATYPAAHHGSQPQGPVPSYSTQMTPLNYGHTRSPYDGSQAAYLDYSAPPRPPSSLNVISCSPTHGKPGTHITISFTASWDMTHSNTPSLVYQYGGRSRKISTNTMQPMSRENSQDHRQYHYLLSSQVPQLPDISEWVSEVPIMLVVDSPTGEEYETQVGNFSYEQEYAAREPLQPEDIRQSMRAPDMGMRNEVPEYQYQQPAYNSYRPQYSMGAPYDSLPAHSHLNHQLQAPPMQQHNSQPFIQSASQYRNNNISARQLPTLSPSNPKLVRTSTLDAFRSPLGNSGGAYYHQAMKPPPVHLRFDSQKLESIGRADTWPEEDLRMCRRVVYFTRKQQGAEIYLTFSIAKRDEAGGGGSSRPHGTLPVSCILWPRKNQCFVTSVDTIMLLQFIMAQNFPTEEKNRIRRNLEHFKPVTVKKPIPGSGHGSGGSEDTNELFTTIMGFSAPKPRNIEKDIKVFRWKDLNKALLKITSKYSIKPSSNSLPPSLPAPQQQVTPASSTGGSSGYSMDNTGLYLPNDRSNVPFSPRSSATRSISGAGHGYAPASFANSSQNQRLSPPYRRQSLRGNNDMHHPGSLNQMSSFEQGVQHSSQAWSTTPSHHMPMPHPHASSQYGTPRPSWDLGMPGALANSLSTYPENSGGAATAAEMGHTQAQDPPPRTALPLTGDGIPSSHQQHHENRGSVSGLLRHHVGSS